MREADGCLLDLLSCALVPSATVRKPPLDSNLLKGKWGLGDERSPYQVVIPNGKALAGVDEEWPSLRDDNEPSRWWLWSEIAEDSHECLALFTRHGQVAALWGSGREPLILENKRFYRLDFMEVFPPLRKHELGALTLALIACRAGELECKGVVLGSFRRQTGFYVTLGGTQRKMKGWKVSSKLVTFVFEGRSFEDLQGHADAIREETASGPATRPDSKP